MRPPVDVRIGEPIAPRTIGPITQTDIVRFAGAGGDFNPLHHDLEFVKTSGFPGVIAMGQMQAGMLGGWLSDHFGVEHLRSYECRFVAPVFLGDSLELSGQVESVENHDGQTLADVTLRASRGDVDVIRASARVVVTTA